MNILFVCTENTFRSASADYLFNTLLQEKQDDSFQVHSAGIRCRWPHMYEETKERLAHYGIAIQKHQSTYLTQKLVDEADVIICMAEHHRQFIKHNFHTNSYLFNELAYGESTDVQDDEEVGTSYGSGGLKGFIYDTIDYIYQSLPKIYEKLKTTNY